MKKLLKKFSKNDKGFGLTEVMLTLVIVGILSGLSVAILHTQAKTYNQVYFRSILTSEGRNALRLLRSELRAINPARIDTLEAGTLAFTDTENNTVSYHYQNNELLRNGQVILKNLSVMPFEYLDKDQNVTTQTNALRFIKISLQLAAGNESAQMEEIIYVRN